ncbi:MAG TPA: site-2 protease family protein [Anaerolineae bacterium]|nr:site-2 protease family protein [Anaerolineae bacterium]HQI83810.1 site-2 protease family protein [Anaerolineae bacterium]
MDFLDEDTVYSVAQEPQSPVQISPVFGAMVGGTALAGLLIYRGGLPSALRTLVFMLFVIGGWMISLSLHEFGHALAAYWGGDKSVVNKGYLTLNPFRYTHVAYSIVLPLLYLAMGGIGLPGGAVYINAGAIRSKLKRGLTSAAGPAATAVCAFVLLLPFITGLARAGMLAHRDFWAGIALLAFLQLTGLFFNLIPIPGFDGWGILEIVLPASAARTARAMSGLTFMLILIFFMNNTAVSRGFWQWIILIGLQFRLDFTLVREGLKLFRFWMG